MTGVKCLLMVSAWEHTPRWDEGKILWDPTKCPQYRLRTRWYTLWIRQNRSTPSHPFAGSWESIHCRRWVPLKWPWADGGSRHIVFIRQALYCRWAVVKLHSCRLRFWHTLCAPICHNHCIEELCLHLSPSRHIGHKGRTRFWNPGQNSQIDDFLLSTESGFEGERDMMLHRASMKPDEHVHYWLFRPLIVRWKNQRPYCQNV